MLVVVLAVVLSACGGSAGSTVAASVGDTEISVADVDAAYDQRAQASGVASELAGDDSGAVEDNLKAGVLTNLIRTEILRRAAEDSDIEVTDADIADQREQLVQQAGGEDALDQVIEDANLSEEELRSNLHDQVIQNKITAKLADKVSDDDVRAAYEEDPQGQYGPKVEVRHILTETKKQAQQAIDRVESGEDFADVAKDMSTDTASAKNGGELGPVPKGATVPAFEKAAFNADEGELVGPVKTQFGYHVLEVTDTVAAPKFADVEQQIRTQLQTAAGGQAFNDYITAFVKDLDIEVDERYGSWDAATVAVVPEDEPSEPALAPSAAPPPSALATEPPSG